MDLIQGRTHLKLGTRRSLLARTQSLGVAQQIESLQPNIKIKLIEIDTRGDFLQEIPLRAVDGKEFFVAELDAALHASAVDFTVHSLKDLSLNRPQGLHLAAIPKRENPRDVILFGPSVLSKVQNGEPLKIGTSAPRRLENIPLFLEKALPSFSKTKKSKLEFLEIRGNVNTRLSRLHEPLGSDRQLDAVVLAMAGLIRLFSNEVSRAEIETLLQNARWMVLPLRECPTAPGQGALAVECRANDKEVIQTLSLIHDSVTADHVSRERNLLAKWGGGCHQKFGATVIPHSLLGELFYVRGEISDQSKINKLYWEIPARQKLNSGGSPQECIAWDGTQWGEKNSQFEEIPNAFPIQSSSLNHRAVFIAHSRALPCFGAQLLEQSRVWTSGVSSWFRLAALGVWVEGCAENLGFESLEETLLEPVLTLPPLKNWLILTYEGAQSGWQQGEVLATYRVHIQNPDEAQSALRKATHIYWNSSTQFERLKNNLVNRVHHSSGPGKTAQYLRENHINPVVFPTVEEWRKWMHGL
jgi:hydroxymethylbilane synthase